MTQPIKVLLCDDHTVFRSLVKAILRDVDGKPFTTPDTAERRLPTVPANLPLERYSALARRIYELAYRKPQPDYFQGPTAPNMWSWLEVYPQHVFRNAKGEKEQMSVGAAQNAIGDRDAAAEVPGNHVAGTGRCATNCILR